MAEFTYEIINTIATLSTSTKGWTKELNLISWNGAPAKYDIRDWAPDHEKMGKGITLTQDELEVILAAFSSGVPEEFEEEFEEEPEEEPEEPTKEEPKKAEPSNAMAAKMRAAMGGKK